MKKKSVSVFAPASVSNVSCGFDVLGFAIASAGDTVTIKVTESSGLNIGKISGDSDIPKDVDQNLVTISAKNFLNKIGYKGKQGFEFDIEKMVKPGSGLGSSASSTVATLVGINEIFDRPLSDTDLLGLAMKSEESASGSPHADNVAPSLFGGFVLIRGYDPIDIIHLHYPSDLYVALVHPQIIIKTSDARQMLPEKVPLKDAITQWGNLAGLISGLYQEDYELISRSLKDVIIEPARQKLIPELENAKRLAAEHGALGCGISGSGPSIYALCKGKETADKVITAFKELYRDKEYKCVYYISPIGTAGAKLTV